MARRRRRQQDDDTLIDIVEVKDQAQGFVEKNQNLVFGTAIGVIAVIGLVFAYINFFEQPRNLEAMDAMAQAQIQFEQDSFSRALINPSAGTSGFLDIIDNYGGTKAGNLSRYYAGICYLNLGQYEVAIDYLEDYKTGGSITPIMKSGAIGDAYAELGDFNSALKFYKKAANTDKVDVLTSYYLMKYGMLSEKQGDMSSALDAYTEIKTEYPNTPSGRDIDKYIMRVQ
ncbi:MAG: tetratricopeptide repeat protein [Bacteroidia bacterium]|nr:tetratricopeptide repeat protein [Bacteroidia bacterium]